MQEFIGGTLIAEPRRKRPKTFSKVLLLEDNAHTAERRLSAGVGSSDAGSKIRIRVHCFSGSSSLVAAGQTYRAGSLASKRNSRIEIAVRLLKRAAIGKGSVVVAGTTYGCAPYFLEQLSDGGFPFVVQLRPTSLVDQGAAGGRCVSVGELLGRAHWQAVKACLPDGSEVACSAASLGEVLLSKQRGTLFAAQIGGIEGLHRGTIIGLSSFDGDLRELLRLISYSRWIRGAIRRTKRRPRLSPGAQPKGRASTLTARANIAIARKQDEVAYRNGAHTYASCLKGRLARGKKIVNVVETFAGAGGMGLGFLMAGSGTPSYRIVYSGEVNPVFTQTLRCNHATFERLSGRAGRARTPENTEAVDLRERRALQKAASAANEVGGADVIIGGPPCQGFSTANRNSWSSSNPHNELVDVFLKYIRTLRPRIFLMENVQGILWTPKRGSSVSVVDVIEEKMRAAGYILFPKLLDAIWYGVPQHRTRFFLLGLHRDLGYTRESFGDWGPFPLPTHGHGGMQEVTVLDAIGDLPEIGNGAASDEVEYCDPSRTVLRKNLFLQYARQYSPKGVVSDHVTSRHAEYVIDRYSKIPQGGNWEDIRECFTNYADVSRTHSNIYRRLGWGQPSITIGHYRKSMLVHPSQHRGLSLREACRLQSFPDWFRFSGTTDGRNGGLVHKQQQLANAVCPLVTKAIAEYLLRL